MTLTNGWLGAVAILLCGVANISLRMGGLAIARRLPETGRVRRFMDALPGSILVALIAPSVVEAGIWGLVATVVTSLIALRTHNALLGMVAGMAIIAAQRYLAG